MKFSTRAGDARRVQSDKQSRWLRTFKPGETTVRFLLDTEDMADYWEHWTGNESYPCTRDRNSCPGCTSDDERTKRASHRYGVPVLERSTGRVEAYKVPASLYKRLELREARHGTLTDRDYIVVRTGTGLETDYDVEGGDVYRVDVDEYLESAPDIDDILQEMYEAVFGELPEEEEEPKPVAKKAPAKKAAAKKAEPKPKPVEEDVPPTKGSDSDDEESIEEADLYLMPYTRLIEVAGELGLDDDEIQAADSKQELIGKILEFSA